MRFWNQVHRRIVERIAELGGLADCWTSEDAADLFYAATLPATRLKPTRELGWTPQVDFAAGLADTVEWYRANEWWWRPIKDADPAFRSYYKAQYGDRRS
jgi:dTDP-glucose 4,6-dehydratase